MKNPLICAALILVAATAPISAQTPTPTPANDLEDVVKITTKVVQIDVLVTDKKGEQVRDLKPSDFELRQDGKIQQITGLTYVSADPEAKLPKASTITNQKSSIVPPPPRRVGNTEVGRVIAFVVDDGSCDFTLWGSKVAQDGLRRFINEQMLPDDWVAIYHTLRGTRTYQRYTNDKLTLLKAVDKIRWLPPDPSCLNAASGSFSSAAQSNIPFESEAERRIRQDREGSAADYQVIGAAGVLHYVLNGME